MANNNVLKISGSELADLALAMKKQAKGELQIAQHASPYIPQERPREGVGGTNEHPFDDFGNDRNPPIINPATGKPEWAGTNQEMKIAHGEGRGPQQKFHDEYNRPLDKPPYRSIYPSGETLDIDWQKEKYMKDHPQFFPEQQANMKDSLQRENVGGTLRDMMLPLLIKEYGKDGSGGYKNPSKLLSGMKKLAKNLPANNIRRLQDSGHMTIQDPDDPKRLKIIDLLGPQA